MKINKQKLLEIQHEYSRFCILRNMTYPIGLGFDELGNSEDLSLCMNILECCDWVDLNEAKTEILEFMGYDFERKCFKYNGWQYDDLDKIIMKYVGEQLYSESY